MAKTTKKSTKKVATAGVRGFVMGGGTGKGGGSGKKKTQESYVNLLPTVDVRPKKKTFWQKFNFKK